MVFAQEASYYTVKAERGDGIFSLLRKQGLDPVRHYGEFLELNAGVLKGDSFLKVGEGYRIPKAEDAFTNTGVVVRTELGVEESIFDRELAQMSLRSDELKEVVYYIIAEDGPWADGGFVGGVIKRLAADLMVHGAKVYVMGARDSLPMGGPGPKGVQRLGTFIDAVNKRYLQNSGKYQRVLVIRTRDLDESLPVVVRVQHHDRNEQGQRLALNIQKALERNRMGSMAPGDSDMVFQDRNSLYLSNNILPALSLLTMENVSKTSGKRPGASPNGERFAQWIGDGILNDFAELKFED